MPDRNYSHLNNPKTGADLARHNASRNGSTPDDPYGWGVSLDAVSGGTVRTAAGADRHGWNRAFGCTDRDRRGAEGGDGPPTGAGQDGRGR